MMDIILSKDLRLPWHHALWTWMDERVQSNTLPHAILLHGHPGMGKNHFANQFAARMLCEDIQHNMSCGQCRACLWVAAGTQLDYHIIAPEETGRIRIETIRELIHDLANTSYTASYKIVLIREPEGMQAGAANALLKTLEEPPGQRVLFILVTSQLFLLPATLRSRCQTLEFKPAFEQETQQWLAHHLNLPVEQALNLLWLKEGAPLAVVEYYQNQLGDTELKWREQCHALLAKTTSPLAIARAWSEDNPLSLLDFLQRMVSDAIEIHFLPNQTKVNQTETMLTLELAHLFKIFDDLQSAKQKILRKANLNLQLLMESLVVSFSLGHRSLNVTG